MFKERAQLYEALSLMLDSACMLMAGLIGLMLRQLHSSLPLLGAIPAEPWTMASTARADYAVVLVASIGTLLFAANRTSLHHKWKRVDTVMKVVSGYAIVLVWAGLATGAVVFSLKLGQISRLFFAYYFATGFILLVAKQLTVNSVLTGLRRTDVNKHYALVIGAGKPLVAFVKVLADASDAGYELAGVLLSRKMMSSDGFNLPVLGTIDDLERTLVDHPINEVFIVGGPRDLAELAPVADDLIKKGRVVSLVSAFTTTSDSVRGRITEFSGVPMISFGPVPKDEVGGGVKRLLDVTLSAGALLLLSPVLLVTALLIKVLDPGPVFFSQDRLGVGGRTFKLHKFRSMRTDAEEVLKSDPEMYRKYVENDYKLAEAEDPRISRLGRFLRRSSLDELPQLWNVVRGDMTLVGPRPIVPAEIEMYEPYAEMFLSTRPGVTGHWQVGGRSNVQYPERAFMDLDYIGQHSLGADLEIMARTVPAVLRRKGAY